MLQPVLVSNQVKVIKLLVTITFAVIFTCKGYFLRNVIFTRNLLQTVKEESLLWL
jgi:hypothetical protein